MRRLIIILTLLLASCMSVSAYTGTGTKVDPYLISTAADFLQIPSLNNWVEDRYFKLTSDIDMTGESFTVMLKFQGQLDGDGHTVRGLSRSDNESTLSSYNGNVGLFCQTASSSDVSEPIFNNIRFSNASYTVTTNSGYGNIGLISGKVTAGNNIAFNKVIIDSSTMTVNINAWYGDRRIGSMVGDIDNVNSCLYRTALKNSTINVIATGINNDAEDIYVGGLVGSINYMYPDTVFITESYVDNSVIIGKNTTNKAVALGGLVGGIRGSTLVGTDYIIDSHFKGSIYYDNTSTYGVFIGGITAYGGRIGTINQYKNIDRCYSYIDSANGNSWFASLWGAQGSTDDATISFGYSHYFNGTKGTWNYPLNNKLQSFGNPTVGQYDTSNVSMLSTIEFADTTNFPTWDFANTWIIEDGFPVLRWNTSIPSYLTMTSPDSGNTYVIGDTILISWDYLPGGLDSIIYIYDENILVDSTSDSLYYYIMPYSGNRTINIISKEGMTDSSIVVIYDLTNSFVRILSASSDSVTIETINIQELEYSYSIDSLHWTIVDTLLISRGGATAKDTTLLLTSLSNKKYIKMEDAAIIDTLLQVPQNSSNVYTGTISGSNIYCNTCVWNGNSLRVVEDNSCGWVAKDYTRFTRSFDIDLADGSVNVQTIYDKTPYDKNYCSDGELGYSLNWDEFICTAIGGSPGQVPPDSAELPLIMDGREYTTEGRDIYIYDPINDISYVFYTCPDVIGRLDIVEIGQSKSKYVIIWTEGSSTNSISPSSCVWSYRIVKTFDSFPSGKTEVVQDIYTLLKDYPSDSSSKSRDYFRGIFQRMRK